MCRWISDRREPDSHARTDKCILTDSVRDKWTQTKNTREGETEGNTGNEGEAQPDHDSNIAFCDLGQWSNVTGSCLVKIIHIEKDVSKLIPN